MPPSSKTRPTKLWRGKKRLAKKFLGRTKKILGWAISISPGDWIATCEGCNRQVADIEYIWVNEGWFRRSKPNKTWALYEVKFVDTRGRWHYCPGGGCALPRESLKEIEDYHKEWIALRNEPCAEKRAFESGDSIVDENGEYLPEFDSNHPERTGK